MATTTNPAKTLMGSFKELGLTPAQVRHFVPQWWDDAAASEEGGLLELQLLLARRLNISLDSLQAAAPRPEFREATNRFKTIHPDGSTQLAVAAGVGHGLAQVLAAACKTLAANQMLASQLMRDQILGAYPAVTLHGLCHWLWDHGIPIVHITNWPKDLRRPDAMCVKVAGRAVVMVVRKEVAPARLAYLVAHEIGHVMSGHLNADNNTVLVDETLPVDAQGFASDDDERVADGYAMELLGGSVLRAACESLKRKYFEEVKLAIDALAAAKGKRLDAGQVVLGWARLTSEWNVASMAMRYLMTTQAAPMVVNELAHQYLNAENLSADRLEHLAGLTGITLDAS